MVTDEQGSFVALARFDLAPFIEERIEIPVMFRNYEMLENFSKEHGLVVESFQEKEIKGAVKIRGNYDDRGELFIDMVWAAAASPSYRNAVKSKWSNRNLGGEFPSNLHVDHIVNRASLVEVSSATSPWVMLFEVPWSANSGFGSQVEKHFDAFDPDTAEIALDPLRIFKLYATDFPKDNLAFEKVMDAISKQIGNSEVLSAMRTEMLHVAPHLKPSGSVSEPNT